MGQVPSVEDFRTSNVDSVKVVQVVEVQSVFGDGTGLEGHSPIRQITEYYDLEGNHLATVDKWKAAPKPTKQGGK